MKSFGKVRLVTLGCWCVAALALTGLAVWALTGSLFGMSTGFNLFNIGWIEGHAGEYKQAGAYTAPADGVDSLVIDWIAGSVAVTPYEGDEIQFKEYARRELEENERMYVSVSGGTVTVKFVERTRFGSMPPKRLEALIPRTLCESLSLLDADSTSAEISVAGIAADKLKVDSTSGDIDLTSVRAGELRGHSTSGNLTVSDAVCGGIYLESTSGELRVADSRADALNVSSTSGNQKLFGAFAVGVDLDSISGDITIENTVNGGTLTVNTASGVQTATGAFDSVSFSSISGDVRITNAKMPSGLKINTTSGGVTITLPKESEIDLNHSSVSGAFSSDIPVAKRSDRHAMSVSTISGDVRILVLE